MLRAVVRGPLTNFFLLDIVLAVTEVRGVLEAATAHVTFVAASALNTIALLHRSEGRANVFEFVVDIEGEFRQADDHAENGDGGYQDQFSRDNETGVVVDQLAAERHVSDLFLMG